MADACTYCEADSEPLELNKIITCKAAFKASHGLNEIDVNLPVLNVDAAFKSFLS